MIQEKLYDVILAPHVSEKASIAADKSRQFVFRVARDANKFHIKQAVEHLFDVKVENVRVLRVQGKAKRFKQKLGQRAGWKKAYVTLAEGHDIDFTTDVRG